MSPEDLAHGVPVTFKLPFPFLFIFSPSFLIVLHYDPSHVYFYDLSLVYSGFFKKLFNMSLYILCVEEGTCVWVFAWAHMWCVHVHVRVEAGG